jgi:hypothetical protein
MDSQQATVSSEARIFNARGEAQLCELRFTVGEPWWGEVSCPVTGPVRREGSDLFEALKCVRRELEKFGLRIGVNGARLDAWPSSLSRHAGGATRLFPLKMGVSSNDYHIAVRTFDPAEFDTLSTVDQQEDYLHRWAESVGLQTST